MIVVIRLVIILFIYNDGFLGVYCSILKFME